MQLAEDRSQLADLIRERGPVTVAAFMELALYDPRFGYYARATRRSGRAGDFFTSVDVGAIFGQLLAEQVAEMARLIGAPDIDLVEAGAGDGRLSADILEALRRRHPALYPRIRLHLVEASEAARGVQADTLGADAPRLASSSAMLPAAIEGVVVANELLDALPVHQVVMRDQGLRETYVVSSDDGRLRTTEGAPSTPELGAYLDRLGIALHPGRRAEIGLQAVEWIREAARRLRRGFLVLIDYGHEARDLYGSSHAGGTLTSYRRHTMAGSEIDPAIPGWLIAPGERDITAHVDFTSVRAAAESEGLRTLGFLDQTYFVLGLIGAASPGGARWMRIGALKERLALKTLLLPGGLGSTMKVLILGRDVGTPALIGCSYRARTT